MLKPHFNVLILRLLSAKLKQAWFCILDPVSDGPLVYRFHAVGAPHCGGAGPKQYGRRVKTLVGLVASRRDYLCNHLFFLAVNDVNRLRARVGSYWQLDNVNAASAHGVEHARPQRTQRFFDGGSCPA